uniref:Uncharacterized protein n=1 Tax=Romanomermis culicivorax TaxID=13658 RepID=A0A915KV67_ROMCU
METLMKLLKKRKNNKQWLKYQIKRNDPTDEGKFSDGNFNMEQVMMHSIARCKLGILHRYSIKNDRLSDGMKTLFTKLCCQNLANSNGSELGFKMSPVWLDSPETIWQPAKFSDWLVRDKPICFVQ